MKETESDIKFTVIIPTRERADTLRWSLETCTAQDYGNFEIIVSDNFSQDETRQIVESNGDSRIRYINTGRRVSMTGNYEFALRHATGDYVCVIGDDDGLMPTALDRLNRMLSGGEIDAVTWKKPFYFWNQWHQVERRNTLHLELKTESEEFDASEMLHKLFTFSPEHSFHFSELASLYHGFVKTEIINRLRSADGRFFYSSAPDVYASLAVTSAIKKFRRSAQPLTMHGISQHSTGFPSNDTKSMRTFLSEEDIAPHPKIKLAPNSASICAAECLLKVQEHVAEANRFEFDIKKLVETAMKEAVYLSPEVYASIVDSVRYIGKTYDIKDYVDKTTAENPNVKRTNLEFFGYDFFRNHLILKLDDAKVKNVYDATVVCQNILNRQSKTFYLLETSRYLSGLAKNFGLKSSLQKGFRRVFNTFGAAL